MARGRGRRAERPTARAGRRQTIHFATMNSIARRLALAALALLPLLACAEPAPPPPPEAQRVEHAELGLAIAALPEPFEPVETSGEAFVLTAPGENGAGTVRITVGEPQRNPNLVEAAKEGKESLEAAPDGAFFGHRSLGGTLGNIYTARGGYTDADGVAVEEVLAYALHPAEQTRILTIRYTYPPGEAQQRVDQLLYLLGEIEGLFPASR